MLTIKLQGGLGNQLFQLAAADTIARQTKRRVFVRGYRTPPTQHSTENYYDSIFQRWKDVPAADPPCVYISEQSTSFAVPYPAICLQGYFQDYKYVSADFRKKLVFDTTVAAKYDKLASSAFLHIRGGDYLTAPAFNLGLDSYYERAIREFPVGTHFYVFTNDRPYASTKAFLQSVPHTFVDESEVDSLYLMTQCELGGICPNSSFSWWGAFLNPNRCITMPNKWFSNNGYSPGYYFDGVKQIDV
jgi:hypothetical protein